MKKYVSLWLGLVSAWAFSSNAEPGLLTKIYGSIFGNQPASHEYQEKVREALSALGSNSHEISVNQMNGVGPTFAGQELSSFTAFGIWVNEKLLNSLNKNEQTFQLYHEAAHYTQKHHQKILAAGILVLPILGFGLKKLYDYCKSKSLNQTSRLSIVGTTGLAVLGTLYFYVLPKIVKEQEKEADILAAQALINSGNSSIFEEYLESLKQLLNVKQPMWWYSIEEQIAYLQNIKI